MADAKYEHPEWVEAFVLKVKPKTIIVTTTGGGMEEMLERVSILRGDLYYKAFVSDPWESSIGGRSHAARLRDYLFINYLKFNKGRLFLFPSEHKTYIGLNFSDRMQDVIVLAHQNKIAYDIIQAPIEEDE